MPFTYYALPENPLEINPESLRHRYFVQLAPDGQHLVPGSLVQGRRPAIGHWLELGYIGRELPERYFVQYTDFNTLVPGSLVRGDTIPKGKWKEVKRPSIKFHRVTFTNPYVPAIAVLEGETPQGPHTITSQDEFVTNRVIPPLLLIYPDVPLFTTGDLNFNLPGPVIYFNLYYFKGSFAELDYDASKLTPFDAANYFMLKNNVNVIQPATNIGAWQRTPNSVVGEASAPAGAYCIVLGVLDAQKEIKDYVVLENIYAQPVYG